MTKASIKRMFKAIEDGDDDAVIAMVQSEPESLEAIGYHNRLVRDKTPLMFAMQCRNLLLAGMLLDLGANAAAEMPGGSKDTVLTLCMVFAFSDRANHDQWVGLARRLLDLGADPNTGLWPALHSFSRIVPRKDLIELLLNRGADPDFKGGNCGNTIRELVLINRNLYTNDVLSLFGIDPDPPPP